MNEMKDRGEFNRALMGKNFRGTRRYAFHKKVGGTVVTYPKKKVHNPIIVFSEK